ncbi:unnamed protein product, partial [Heterotrigona itama]
NKLNKKVLILITNAVRIENGVMKISEILKYYKYYQTKFSISMRGFYYKETTGENFKIRLFLFQLAEKLVIKYQNLCEKGKESMRISMRLLTNENINR